MQFKEGAAILSREEFDRLIRKPALRGNLFYERSEIEGNKYHGNLLLKQSVTKKVMQKIAANIALMCVIDVVKE